MFLIERYWFDPLENRHTYGWVPIGFVSNEAEAKRIVNLKQYEVAKNKWPLAYAVKNGEKYAPAFRYKQVAYVDGKSLEELEALEIIYD